MKILQRPRRQAPVAAASRPADRPGRFEVTTLNDRASAETPLSRQGVPHGTATA